MRRSMGFKISCHSSAGEGGGTEDVGAVVTLTILARNPGPEPQQAFALRPRPWALL